MEISHASCVTHLGQQPGYFLPQVFICVKSSTASSNETFKQLSKGAQNQQQKIYLLLSWTFIDDIKYLSKSSMYNQMCRHKIHDVRRFYPWRKKEAGLDPVTLMHLRLEQPWTEIKLIYLINKSSESTTPESYMNSHMHINPTRLAYIQLTLFMFWTNLRRKIRFIISKNIYKIFEQNTFIPRVSKTTMWNYIHISLIHFPKTELSRLTFTRS